MAAVSAVISYLFWLLMQYISVKKKETPPHPPPLPCSNHSITQLL